MANLYKDTQYMSICSEKTLQSNDKGFFLTFADHVAETVGENWISGVFAKLKNDHDRIRSIYEDETSKKVVCEVLSHVQEIYRKKSSEISQSRRIEAERAFHCGDLVKALTLYSQSVLRAQPTGQNNRVDAGNTLALALWGRSKVLFATGEFSLALSDLQMALKENLPESYKGDAFSKMALCYKALGEPGKSRVCWDLTKKLLKDKKKLTLLEEDLKKDLAQAKKSSRKILPTITGRAHEVFKNASKKISVEHSKDKGRFVVANESIKTGETLVVEPPYAACLLPECFGTHCHHCFERLINPIGCPTCSNVAFCHQSCRDEALSTYHQYECKFLDLLIGSGMSILSHTALRSITQKTLQESLDVHKDTSKEMVYSLCTLSKLRPANDFLQRTLMGAFLLRCLQKSGFFGKDTNRVVPNDDEYKIGELLLFHLQMLQFNAHEIYETRHGADHRFRNAKAAYIGVAVYPTVALFNHDCYPAVTRYFVGKNIVINAVRPLKPHDVIAENYGPIFTRKTLPERQRSLSSRYWFHCKCLPCEQNWPSLDTGLDNIAKRLRCPNGKCPNTFTLPLQKDTITCPKCNRKGSLKEALVKLEECEKNYGRAFELLDQQKPEEALGILCQTIDTFHSISSPPHRDTHLAQEILRACMADSGNAYECLIKM